MADMDGVSRRLSASINAFVAENPLRRVQVVAYLTGGASFAQAALCGRGGASKWLAELRVPYSRGATNELLPHVTKYCSMETSVELAKNALTRSASLAFHERGQDSDAPPLLVGLACTASLSYAAFSAEVRDAHKLAPRGGRHCYAATVTNDGRITQYTMDLDEHLEPNDREEEERLTSRLCVEALARVVLGDAGFPSDLGLPKVRIDRNHVFSTPGAAEEEMDSKTRAIRALLRGDAQWLHFWPGQTAFAVDPPLERALVLSGSFNPVHQGHLELAEVAKKAYPDYPLVFEIAVVNADKPALEEAEILKRLAQFSSTGHSVVLTKAPLFLHKTKVFRKSVFVVGADTIERLVDSKYYRAPTSSTKQEERDDMLMVVSRIVLGSECKFLVAGRKSDGRDVFASGRDAVFQNLPLVLAQEGFEFIDEASFRSDLSSTQLRKKLKTRSEGDR